MTPLEPIVRLAAKGDGVTEKGQHVKGGLPGDWLDPDGVLQRGKHYVTPPCPQFGRCGGCQLQHADEAILKQFVRDRVVNAAHAQGLDIGQVLPVHLSPPTSRRRATLHALKRRKGTLVGFHEARTHRIIDAVECTVLRPELANLLAPLRELVANHGGKGPIDLQLTLCDQGVEVNLKNLPLAGLSATEDVIAFAQSSKLARLTLDQGFGSETMWEPEPATVTLSSVSVSMPPGAFLQATEDAEDAMLADVCHHLGDATLVADLFSGLGTFAFAARRGKGRKVLAVEAQLSAHLACKAALTRAGGNVIALHRDLFRSPLQPDELERFDAVVIDPPRAGAKAQIAELAESACERVVYVSCNPSSWSRDGARLTEAGFKLETLRPVGQFRWSTHVELVSLFVR
ncbi:MAG: class I SAM-dependent RNA methyltransferase [Pseudomonadota bacterium]